MVAYSFKPRFVPFIQVGAKKQTVRAHRKRHARPGERLQLYTGMRTKQCARILTEGPVCIRVDEITMPVGWCFREAARRIAINGIPLSAAEMEAFAKADGFAPTSYMTAVQRMGAFWRATHGDQGFEGVVIHWDWAP